MENFAIIIDESKGWKKLNFMPAKYYLTKDRKIMKVLLINGSRREHGCTYTALQEIAKVLKAEGIDSEIFFVGNDAVNGNIDQIVDDAALKAQDCQGLIVGSPVYYASPSGEIIAFLDRLFTVAGADLRHKPAAAITSARRAGTTVCIDVINKYFAYNQMPIVSSNYWNMVHGNTPDEVLKDEEGVQIMQVLGQNMAWLLKCIESGKSSGIKVPQTPDKIKTNFVR